jgi:hypothetical protein
MYLGTIYISTEFRPDRTSNMAPGGHLGNQQSAITPEVMTGSSDLQIFILGTSNKDT